MIAVCLRPKTKKKKEFLELAVQYSRFVPNYSDVTSSMTDLTKKGVPDLVQRMEPCQQTSIPVKAALFGRPLLHFPNFSPIYWCHWTGCWGHVVPDGVWGETPMLYISHKLSVQESTSRNQLVENVWPLIWQSSPIQSVRTDLHSLFGPHHTAAAPPHEKCQCTDLLVSGN